MIFYALGGVVLDIRELESVCAVDTYGNYSEAAYRIASSASIISKHVSKVEQQLGFKIFERASKSTGCKLTEQGQQIINYLHLIVDLWGNTLKKASEIVMSEQDTLTVGYMPFIGTYRENEIFYAFPWKIPR